MTRYLVLINFTEKGIAAVQDSVQRAQAFDAAASKVGAKIEAQFWTVGPYDGAFVLAAPDEKTAAGLVLTLGKLGTVKTTMLRAFDAGEFTDVVASMP